VPGKQGKRDRINRARAKRVIWAALTGVSYEVIAKREGITVKKLHDYIGCYTKWFWNAYDKWEAAESRCRVMAMELNLLRIGKEAPRDRPLESLHPPELWMKWFKIAGIETVNQLRSVDSKTLLDRPRFATGAIEWAILKLGKAGLSHRLTAPQRPKYMKSPRSISLKNRALWGNVWQAGRE
jgi:hypothetical protein